MTTFILRTAATACPASPAITASGCPVGGAVSRWSPATRRPHLILAVCALASALVLGLSGCAGLPDHSSNDTSATTATPAEPAAVAVERPATEPVAETLRLPEDGIVAEFKAAQVKLPAETLALLARFAETRDPNERVEITGYCNKRDAPIDARDIALMRATAVRRELVRLGVPAKSIRVKFNTTQALHAVKMEVKDGAATAAGTPAGAGSTPPSARIELAEKAPPAGPTSTAATAQTGCACAVPAAATR